MAQNSNTQQANKHINPADFYYQLLSGRYYAFSNLQQKHVDQAAKAQGWSAGYLEMLGVLKEVLHFIHENALFYPVKDLATWMESVRQLQVSPTPEVTATSSTSTSEFDFDLDMLVDNLDILDADTLEEVKTMLVLSDEDLNTNKHNLPEALLEGLRSLKKEKDLGAARASLRSALLELKNQPQLFKQLTNIYKQADKAAAEHQDTPGLGH